MLESNVRVGIVREWYSPSSARIKCPKAKSAIDQVQFTGNCFESLVPDASRIQLSVFEDQHSHFASEGDIVIDTWKVRVVKCVEYRNYLIQTRIRQFPRGRRG